MFQTLIPNLMTESVEDTCTFYTEKLGFSIAVSVPNSETGLMQFAILMKDGVQIMFQERENFITEYPTLKTNRTKPCCSLFINVDEVAQLYAALEPSVAVAAPLHTSFYGTDEFAIVDNNGYIITFATHQE